MKIFYVCSYGGSGSKMLCQALNRYGRSVHIHSRCPPDKLEFVGGAKTYVEWFNGTPIPEDKLECVTVIYIYKNPIKAIYSRFENVNHLNHIQCKPCKLADVLASKKDLYGIQNFYQNYTTPNSKRNYKIVCVKYEDIFEKQNELSEYLGIGPLNLTKQETHRPENMENTKILEDIYKDLLDDMREKPFLHVV